MAINDQRALTVIDNRIPPLVFIHSSFRTGSTWLWQKFRQDNNTLAFYEIYNVGLASLTQATLNFSPTDWNSRHPVGAPYFLEFLPLIQPKGGVRGFETFMTYENFFTEGKSRDAHWKVEQRYIHGLIDLSQNTSRIPVLSCTRSLGRIEAIKKTFGGVHIVIKRNIFAQWFSYVNQYNDGNSFFIDSIVAILYATSTPPFLEPFKEFLGSLGVNISRDGNGIATSPIEPTEDLFALFAALHLFLYLIAEPHADIVIYPKGRTFEAGYRVQIEGAIAQATTLKIDLSDFSASLSAAYNPIKNVNSTDVKIRALLQSVLVNYKKPIYDALIVDELMTDLWEEHGRYIYYAENAYKVFYTGDSAASKDVRFAELFAAKKEVDALKAEIAPVRAARDGLAGERDHLLGLIDQLGATNATALDRASQLEVDLQNATLDVRRLEEVAEDLRAQAAASGEELSRAVKEAVDGRAILGETQTSLERIREQNHALREELDQRRVDFEKIVKSQADFARLGGRAEERLQFAERRLADFENREKVIIAEKNALQSNLNKVKSLNITLESGLTDAQNSLKAKQNELNKSNENLKRALIDSKELLSERGSLRQALMDLEENLAAAEVALISAEQKHADLLARNEAERSNHSGDLSRLNLELEYIGAENSAKLVKIEDLRSSYQALHAEKISCALELSRLKTAYDVLEEEHKRTSANLSVMDADLLSATRENTELSYKLIDAERRLVEGSDEISTLRKERDAQLEILAMANAGLAAAHEQIEHLNIALVEAESRQDISNLRANELDKQISDLHERLQSTSTDLDSEKSARNLIETQLAEKSKILDRLYSMPAVGSFLARLK